MSQRLKLRPAARCGKRSKRPTRGSQRILRLELLESRCLLAPVFWDGGGDGGRWSDPLNWSGNVVPAAADDVTINFGSGTVQHDTGADTVNSLTTTNPFTLADGTLSILTTLQVNNTFLLAGGTLSGGTVNFASGQTLAMTSSVNNRLTGVTVNGDLTLSADSSRVKIEEGTTFTTAHLFGNSSAIGFAPGQTLTGTILFGGASTSSRYVEMNGAAGTLTISSSGAIKTAAGFAGIATGFVGTQSIFGGSMTLVNEGLISAAGSGTLRVAAASFNNRGTIQVTAGALTLNGNWSSTGPTVVSGGELNLGGTFSTAGLGPFNRTGGTVNITGTLNNTGATLTLNNNTGSWNLAAQIVGGVTGGTVTGGTVNLVDGQTLAVTTDIARLVGVTINGDLTVAAGGARVQIEGGTTFTNAHLSGGELAFAPGQTVTGNILFKGSGGEQPAVGMTGTGTLTIGPTGSVKTVAGFGAGGYLGKFLFGHTMTLVNQGLISAEASNTELVVNNATSFTNTGTMAVDAGSTLRLFGTANWSNPGTLRVAGGALELYGTLTTAAFGLSSIIHTGGTVNLMGTLDNAGAALQVNNTYRLNGGTLSGGTVSFAAGQALGVSSSSSNRLVGVTVNGDLSLAAVFSQVKIEGGTTFANAHLSGNSSSLGFAPGQMVTGNILFEGTDNGIRAVEMNGTTGMLTIGPTGSIKAVAGFGGTGYIGLTTNYFGGAMTLVNQGLISAEALFKTLTVQPSNGLTNSGTVQAIGGANLDLTGQISGGTLSTLGAGKLLLTSATLQSVTLAGTAEVQSNSFVKGGLTLDGGQLIVNANRKLVFQAGNQLLAGYGTVQFAGTGGALEVEANRQLKIGAGVVILGSTGTNSLLASASGASGVIDSIISTAPAATVALVGNWTDRSTRIVPANLTDGGPLTPNLPTPGKISVAGEQDNWTYFARAGQGLSIFLNPASGVSPALGCGQLQIVSPANNVIGTAAAIAKGQSVQLSGFTFPADGTYTIRVQACPSDPSAVGNYLLSAYGATLNTRSLVLNQPVTGILESHYGTDRWTFAANANQQVQFHLLGAASPGIRFRLTGPNGFVGFTDLSANSGLVNLPTTGEYVLQATGNLTGFGAYTMRLDATSQTELTVGVAHNGLLPSSGLVQLFKVDVAQSTPLLIRFDGATDTDRTEVYARLGSPPTRQTSDARFDAIGSDHRLEVPFATPGTWYVLVYGDHVPSPSDFTLVVEAPLVATLAVTPAYGGVGVQSPVTITGLGFVPGTQFDLVPIGGGSAIPAQLVSIDSTTQASATFLLTGATLGNYDVRATLPTGPSSSLPGAFEIGALAGSSFQARLILPEAIGRRAVATLYLEYENTGTMPLAAPILIVQSGNPADRPWLTLDQSRLTGGFWTSANPDGFAHSVQIYASGAAPGVLQPGERIRVPIYYAGLEPPLDINDLIMELELRVHVAGDTTAIDWPALENELRPDWIAADAWPAVFANLQSQIGATWGDYVRALNNNALYLSRLGVHVSGATQLYGFELQQALGIDLPGTIAAAVDAVADAPGLPLTFGRSFGNTIAERYRIGPLGRGWNTFWPQFAETLSDGTVIVHESADAQRRFQPDVRRENTYFSQTGDSGTLRKVAGGAYELTESSGLVTRFLADGRLDLVRDTHGNAITAAYTSNRLTSLSHSSGQTLGFTYNAAGRIASVIDPFGRATTFGYDPTGSLLLTATGPAGTTTYTYSTGNGAAREYALTSITDPSGVTQSFEYDLRGRLTATFVGANVDRTSYAYDDAGGVTITDAANDFTTIFFDQNGQVARVEDNTGYYVRTQFDANLRPVTQTDAQGATQSTTWTVTGAVRTLTDELGHTTTFTSGGPLNQPLSFSDARGNSTRYTYNSTGDVTATTYGDNSVERLAYDLQGDPDVLTNRRGQTNDLTLNAAGQVTREARSDGTVVDYAYDASGRLRTATDASGTTTLSYDAADRLTRVEYPNGRWLQYAYDAAGRRTRLEDHTGFVTQYLYDAVGRLERLLDAAGTLVVSYTYDSAGRISREDKGNGTFTVYGYDLAGRVGSITHRAPDNTISAEFGYTYDTFGRRVGATTPDGAWTYSYDLTDQLTRAVFASTNPAISNQDLIYEYDALGNRVRTVINGVTTNYTANSLNQYTAAGSTTFNYDLDGNLIQESGPGGTKTYTYDLQNRLIRAQTPQGISEYEYDVLGNRVAVTVNGQRTEYLIDPTGLGDVVGEYAGGSLLAHYTQALGLASRVDASGAAAFYGFDLNGNTALLTGAAGGVINRYGYRPFGEPLGRNESVNNPFQFVGRYGVMNDGPLQFMRARFYSEQDGRFLTQDPLRLGGGQINLYQYVGNDPVHLIDPEGQVGYPSGPPQLPPSPPDSPPPDAPPKFPKICIPIGRSCKEAPPVPKAPEPPKKPRRPANCLPSFTAAGKTFSGPCLDPPSPPPPPAPPPKPPAPPPPPKPPCNLPLTIATLVYNPLVGIPASVFCIPKQGSTDPNEKLGASGFGPQGYIPADTLIPYRINFENLGPGSVPTPTQPATAPAQRVEITDQLSTQLDWNTLEFTEVGFGDTLVTVPAGRANHFDTLSLTYNNRTFDVQVELTFDSAAGQISAVFQTLDPGSALPPDVLTGFLPPEDGTGIGKAHFSYTIQTKAGLATGTELRNIALIRFDGQTSIATNQVDPQDPSQGTDPAKEALNTIDSGSPASAVTPLPALTNATFTVTWSGADDTGGSGVASFDIFVSDNGGVYSPWQTATTLTSASFTGQAGHTYAFYSIATDNVGHVEVAPLTPDAEISITSSSSNDPPLLDSIDDKSVDEGSELSFQVTATDPNAGNLLTYSLDPGAPVGATIDSNTGVFTWTPNDGPATESVTVRVRDNGSPALVDSQTFMIHIVNVAPTATNNAYSVVQGTTLFGNLITDNTGSGADSDPVGINDPLTVSSHTELANGTLTLNSHGSFTYTPHSGFSGTDGFTYTISDGDGGFATATVTIQVAAAPPTTLPIAEVKNGVLRIVGTVNSDLVRVTQLSKKIFVSANFLPNGTRSFTARSITRIDARLQEGNDRLVVAGNVGIPSILDGGEGDDVIYAGRGSSVILGGAGDDQLTGGAGRNVIVGGTGQDKLVGGAGSDLLIAGTTIYDNNDVALRLILKEWTSSRRYTDRVANLREGRGSVLSASSTKLKKGVTFSDDADVDELLGGAGSDWFLGELTRDHLRDKKPSETAS